MYSHETSTIKDMLGNEMGKRKGRKENNFLLYDQRDMRH